MAKKNHKKGFTVRERFFGAYRKSGDWHIIDWSDCNDAEYAELQKQSELPVLSGFFPVPFPGFELDPRVTEILEKSNSALAVDMYKDCCSAYTVSVAKFQDESTGIVVSQLESWEDLQVAVEDATLAGDGKGAWVRLVFVYWTENGISTQAEDVFFLVNDYEEGQSSKTGETGEIEVDFRVVDDKGNIYPRVDISQLSFLTGQTERQGKNKVWASVCSEATEKILLPTKKEPTHLEIKIDGEWKKVRLV